MFLIAFIYVNCMLLFLAAVTNPNQLLISPILSSCSLKSGLLSVGQSFVATVHHIYTNLFILTL